MGTTTAKLNKLIQTKAAIKDALVEKGQNPSDVFSTYANNIKAIPVKKDEQIKTVELNMSTGNQVITPDPNKVLTEVTINKPNTFIESNIKADISIGGIIGTFTSDADAVASDITEGKTAYVNGVKITGTNTNEVNYSTLLTSTYPNRYSITTNLTGVTASASNPETIEDEEECQEA